MSCFRLRTDIPRKIASKYCGSEWKYNGFPCVTIDNTNKLNELHCVRLGYYNYSDFVFPPSIVTLIFEFTGEWKRLNVNLPDATSFSVISNGIKTFVFDDSGIYNFKLETCDRIIRSLSDIKICGEIILSPGNGNKLYGSQEDACCVINIKGLRTHSVLQGENGCRTCFRCVSGLLNGKFCLNRFSINAVTCINGIHMDRSGQWTNQIHFHGGDPALRDFVFGNDNDEKRTKSFELEAEKYAEEIQKKWFFWNVNMAPTDLEYLKRIGGIPLPYKTSQMDSNDVDMEMFFGM